MSGAADQEHGQVIGTTDSQLLIERVDDDAKNLLGYQPAELIGRSLLSLVEEPNVPLILGALAHAFTTSRAIATAPVAVRTKRDQVIRCETVIVPLIPAPSSAFALFPEDRDYPAAKSLTEVRRVLERFSDRITSIDLRTSVPDITEAEIPGVTQLTRGELVSVRKLVAGDRVPAIAAALSLSQNTIRNQLSSVYRKLGVRSQQELVNLFRERGGG
jgi:DNA-binding CsgD family transcriptional regulator